ncbi:hypothetical protein GCM10010472_10270 [Pseudonocardia halophobica]|uniref:ABC transporter family protein n=1 Tax=Pseudonocardia halophobica TaxID=29401 RepID=A0A9W6NYY8_9PSEU|nr:hypothetical protein [Pseudonocardia halophobica]GLL14399.1 hypothetical protein GCM10017577_55460 [Pseudonocardia halophobica]
MGLRLPLGEVTVILGPAVARRRLMYALDEDRARCADGHETGALRLTARVADPLAERMAMIERAAASDAALVLVDRLTDGLDAPQRRLVLRAARRLARPDRAVLVEDADPVAALALADGALRTDRQGAVAAEPIDAVDYLAS